MIFVILSHTFHFLLTAAAILVGRLKYNFVCSNGTSFAGDSFPIINRKKEKGNETPITYLRVEAVTS